MQISSDHSEFSNLLLPAGNLPNPEVGDTVRGAFGFAGTIIEIDKDGNVWVKPHGV